MFSSPLSIILSRALVVSLLCSVFLLSFSSALPRLPTIVLTYPAYHVLPDSLLPCSAFFHLSLPILPCPALPCLSLSCPTLTFPALPCHQKWKIKVKATCNCTNFSWYDSEEPNSELCLPWRSGNIQTLCHLSFSVVCSLHYYNVPSSIMELRPMGNGVCGGACCGKCKNGSGGKRNDWSGRGRNI